MAITNEQTKIEVSKICVNNIYPRRYEHHSFADSLLFAIGITKWHKTISHFSSFFLLYSDYPLVQISISQIQLVVVTKFFQSSYYFDVRLQSLLVHNCFLFVYILLSIVCMMILLTAVIGSYFDEHIDLFFLI